MFISKRKFKEIIAKELDEQDAKIRREYDERESRYWLQRNIDDNSNRIDRKFEKIERRLKELEKAAGINKEETFRCPMGMIDD